MRLFHQLCILMLFVSCVDLQAMKPRDSVKSTIQKLYVPGRTVGEISKLVDDAQANLRKFSVDRTILQSELDKAKNFALQNAKSTRTPIQAQVGTITEQTATAVIKQAPESYTPMQAIIRPGAPAKTPIEAQVRVRPEIQTPAIVRQIPSEPQLQFPPIPAGVRPQMPESSRAGVLYRVEEVINTLQEPGKTKRDIDLLIAEAEGVLNGPLGINHPKRLQYQDRLNQAKSFAYKHQYKRPLPTPPSRPTPPTPTTLEEQRQALTPAGQRTLAPAPAQTPSQRESLMQAIQRGKILKSKEERAPLAPKQQAPEPKTLQQMMQEQIERRRGAMAPAEGESEEESNDDEWED